MPFEQGNQLGTRTKRNHTIMAAKMREAFIVGANKVWGKLLAAQFKDAETNYKVRQYVFDQTIGRPRETLEIEGGVNMNIDKAVILQINKIYGEKQIEGNGTEGNGKANI